MEKKLTFITLSLTFLIALFSHHPILSMNENKNLTEEDCKILDEATDEILKIHATKDKMLQIYYSPVIQAAARGYLARKNLFFSHVNKIDLYQLQLYGYFEENSFDPNHTVENETPLECVLKSHKKFDINTIELLLMCGADPNPNLIEMVLKTKNYIVIDLFLRYNADRHDIDDIKRNSLKWALELNLPYEFIDLLYTDKMIFDNHYSPFISLFNSKTYSFSSILNKMLSSTYSTKEKIDLINLFIKRGINLNLIYNNKSFEEDKETSLFTALKTKQPLKIIELLLKNNANPNILLSAAKGRQIDYPFTAAIDESLGSEYFEMLYNHGADFNKEMYYKHQWMTHIKYVEDWCYKHKQKDVERILSLLKKFTTNNIHIPNNMPLFSRYFDCNFVYKK